MGIRALLKQICSNKLVRRGLLALLIIALFLGGIQLRRWTGDKTRHVRYQHDTVNAFYWGTEVLKESRRLSPDEASANSLAGFCRGYFGLYDRVKQEAYKRDYGLDYPPLRLLVMAIWAKEVRNQFPGVDDGHPKLVTPLLKINLLCELLSAIAIFLLVRLWLERQSPATQSSLLPSVSLKRRALICGLAAASVAWFEPSMILDAHGWPQWDVWILPFYLFAVLASLKNRWFLCGCLLAAGAMFKGQLLFVAPFFVFWPLWEKKCGSLLRFLAGFAMTAALIVSPWILRSPAAWISVAIAAPVVSSIVLPLRSRYAGEWIAGLTAVAAFVVGALTRGSFAWLRIGFIYGSEHYPFLFISSCYNLPCLLDYLGWSLKSPIWTLDFGSRYFAVTPQWALRLVYVGVLAVCAWGAARQWRNRDPRGLMVIALPWLVMFVLLGQMHERYLMWGAVLSAMALGVSIRLSVIHFAISIASTAMIAHVMLIDKKLDATVGVINFLHGVRPYASVLLLVVVAICLWDGISTRSTALRQPRERQSAPEVPDLAEIGAG